MFFFWSPKAMWTFYGYGVFTSSNFAEGVGLGGAGHQEENLNFHTLR